MEKFLIHISDKYPVVKNWIHSCRHFTLPGFDGVPIYEVLKFFIKEIRENTLGINAQAISYSFFLALFPALVFLFTLIPYIPVQGLSDDIIRLIKEAMPSEGSFALIEPTISDIVKKPRGGLLSIGVLSVIYFTSNGVMSLIQSFDNALKSNVQRAPYKTRLVSFALTIVLVSLFVFSVVFLVMGNYLLHLLFNYMHWLSPLTHFTFQSFRIIFVILLFQFSFSLIYYYGPSSKIVKLRWHSTGATIASILVIVFSLLFSYYVKNFGNYNKLYGSLGTIVVLMIWFNWNAFALLLGFVLNKAIYITKEVKKEKAIF